MISGLYENAKIDSKENVEKKSLKPGAGVLLTVLYHNNQEYPTHTSQVSEVYHHPDRWDLSLVSYL